MSHWDTRQIDGACATRPLDVMRRLVQAVKEDPRWADELPAYQRLERRYAEAAREARVNDEARKYHQWLEEE